MVDGDKLNNHQFSERAPTGRRTYAGEGVADLVATTALSSARSSVRSSVASDPGAAQQHTREDQGSPSERFKLFKLKHGAGMFKHV